MRLACVDILVVRATVFLGRRQGLKEQQEKEELQAAREEQLQNLDMNDGQAKFLQQMRNAPRADKSALTINEVRVQPFGVAPEEARAAQRANRMLDAGSMAGTDNPFISHRSAAMDRVRHCFGKFMALSTNFLVRFLTKVACIG